MACVAFMLDMGRKGKAKQPRDTCREAYLICTGATWNHEKEERYRNNVHCATMYQQCLWEKLKLKDKNK